MNKQYTTIQGDQWDYIAYKVYGDEKQGVNLLLNANQQYNDIVVFPAGITLEVPPLERKADNKLPPWKR